LSLGFKVNMLEIHCAFRAAVSDSFQHSIDLFSIHIWKIFFATFKTQRLNLF